jgi:ABC-2 type transport system ATP-binding protein
VPLLVQEMTKRFGSNWALRGATCTLKPGELAGLIGPNGSGKSTLFECIAGLVPVDTGALILDGTFLTPRRRREVLFYMPDGIAPWAEQTAEWTLRFWARLHGATPARRDGLAGALGLGDVGWNRVGALSKGQRKRLLLALALLTPQQYLLLDEPFDGLDLRQMRDAVNVLRRETTVSRTLFLSIHQLTDAERVCDRLVLLNAGTVVGEGTIGELHRRSGTAGGLEEVFLALT